jgi:hypothetical protein
MLIQLIKLEETCSNMKLANDAEMMRNTEKAYFLYFFANYCNFLKLFAFLRQEQNYAVIE